MALFLTLVLAAGCSPGRQTGVVEDSPVPAQLRDLNDLLHSGGAGGRPPTKLSDLDKHKGLFPQGYEAVKSGAVVVLWGAAERDESEIAKGGGQEVVAYEKNVPSSGGYVLLANGGVKKMTAEEFKAAPKGGKK